MNTPRILRVYPMNTLSMTKKKGKRSIKAPIHRIILKTFKTLNTFSTQNLHIRKFCCTFAANYGTELYLDRTYSSRGRYGLCAVLCVWAKRYFFRDT